MEQQVRKDVMQKEGRTWEESEELGKTEIDGKACLR
jgi:hypothetical protein